MNGECLFSVEESPHRIRLSHRAHTDCGDVQGKVQATRSQDEAERMRDREAAILAEIPRLRRYARALLHDADAADDLVQDSLERALTRLDNWRVGDTPRRWLFTIMHHLFVDQFRRTKRRGENAMLPLDNSEALSQPAVQFGHAAGSDVLNALQRIGEERRAALLLVAVEGFSYAEAAELLNIPAGTVMSRVSRGREDLRAVLSDMNRRRSIRVVEP